MKVAPTFDKRMKGPKIEKANKSYLKNLTGITRKNTRNVESAPKTFLFGFNALE